MSRIILFYKYVDIEYPEQIRKWQRELTTKLNLKGRIILGTEGINATLGGSEESLERYMQAMNEHPLFGSIDFKSSPGSAADFPRMRISVKNEIVHLGLDTKKYTVKDTGKHLTPAQAHELMAAKPDDLVIIDTRNDYEIAIGTVPGSINPHNKNFREFPEWVDQNLDLMKDKQVLMYCTGGIRCERASAYVNLKHVAKAVYQIEGGIHRYTEQFPDGFFRGKNYVFDNRTAVKINDDILSTCSLCDKPCDDYTNCINARCNELFLACQDCLTTYFNTCSNTCMQLVAQKAVNLRPDYHGPLPEMADIAHKV